MDKRSQDSEMVQLRDKIKRLCRTRGPDSGIRFVEETPVKLPAEPREGKKKEGQKREEEEEGMGAEEEMIVPVDAGSDHGSR